MNDQAGSKSSASVTEDETKGSGDGEDFDPMVPIIVISVVVVLIVVSCFACCKLAKRKRVVVVDEETIKEQQ